MEKQTLTQLAEMLNNGLSMDEAQPIIKKNNWVQLDFIYDVNAKQRLIKMDGEYIVEEYSLKQSDTYYILTDNWHRTKAFSYEDKFNDETGERIEKYTTDGVNPEWKESSLPTLNEMIKEGTARKIDLLQVIDIYDVSSPEEAREKALKNGVDIPLGAFEHNYNAWKDHYKSQVVVNGYCMFTPCGGGNPLVFRIELYVGLDYQYTYIS